MEKKEREKIRLELLHLKEGGLEDLLLEYAEAVIEDHQEQLEGNCSLTSVPIAKRIDSEVLDIIEQELDKAREEGIKEGMSGMIELLCDKGCASMFAVIDEGDVNKKIKEKINLKTKEDEK